MIWVCRAGKDSIYLDSFLECSKVFLPWEGYQVDLSKFDTLQEYRNLVIKEKGELNRTTISNWSAQLFSFCKGISIGDYVLIPHKKSRSYTFARIVSDYLYNPNNEDGLWHSRDIDIICDNVSREAFSQSMQYSLGAFRTIFKIKNVEECIETINSIQNKR